MTKVFISSTIYDLIDIRSEVGTEIRNLGLSPIMSDSLSSDFNVLPDVNSIESCLTNVRTCDIFIIILSQRYGPILSGAGYPDLSATHLEYLEAKKTNKPIYMYIRDRLEADYTIRKKNKDAKLTWVKTKDEKIFDILETHRKLTSDSESSNWFWIFRDSIELKERIIKDLCLPVGIAKIRSLTYDNKIALILASKASLDVHYAPNYFRIDEIKRSSKSDSNFSESDYHSWAKEETPIPLFWHRPLFVYAISNHGGSVAINPICRLLFNNHEIYKKEFTYIGIDCTVENHSLISLPENSFKDNNQLLHIRISYSTPEGLRVADVSKCVVLLERERIDIQFNYEGKEFIALNSFFEESKEERAYE